MAELGLEPLDAGCTFHKAAFKHMMAIKALHRLCASVSPAELYSYTEEPEFALNRDYFEEDFRSHGAVLCVCVCVSLSD